jgi:Kinesin motor domain
MNDMEKKEGTLPVISASTSNKSVTVIKGIGPKQARTQFSFDNVFTSFSTQQDVFQATLQPVISDVLKGFETCVFAYGQVREKRTLCLASFTQSLWGEKTEFPF